MKAFICLLFIFAIAFAADTASCAFCKTIISQIEQLQAKKGRAAVEDFIDELCSIATDEAKDVCDDWNAYGMDKIVDAIMAHELSDSVCAKCGSC
ncbi:amoebapore B, putative [Entamoeba histolytica HM-3:IMSS]|uniref:Two tm domain protein n=3 Tax=Entamoeba histolytica TaxID=5759 RepID=A0A175JIG4_ENTHI|nr:invapore X, putative [Entamoeba histolytica KU27]EMS12496.1 amoebapore B, putative [Entamoeba histolytica HM-3:IMSS]GAT93490.1 two tm domain protein [Entamoeba histolytica]